MLDIHPASDIERIALYRNVHDVWGRGLPLDEHVRRRLASPQHNRARWFVGCTEGRVATSLGVYALEFRYRGEIVPGIAIGAVHTHVDFRGRGFAPQLIRWVEDDYRQKRGTAISLLYSDVKPGYYARLGYMECPAWEFDFQPDSVARLEDSAASGLRLIPLSAAGPLMSRLYDGFHRELPISIHRSAEYWQYLERKAPRDEVFAIGSTADPAGYLRIGVHESSMVVRDFATRNADAAGALVAAALHVSGRTGAKHVVGWVPQLGDEFLHLAARRAAEVTMLKPLSPEFAIDETEAVATDWFHEIDHV
jgi:predicted acetyltransferase